MIAGLSRSLMITKLPGLVSFAAPLLTALRMGRVKPCPWAGFGLAHGPYGFPGMHHSVLHSRQPVGNVEVLGTVGGRRRAQATAMFSTGA